jgi:hypothetical protein
MLPIVLGSVVLWNVKPPNDPPIGTSADGNREKKFSSSTPRSGAKKSQFGGAVMTLAVVKPNVLLAASMFKPEMG